MDAHQFAMEAAHESAAAADVARRLVVKFPTLPPGVVYDVVTSAFDALAGPVRIFVPLLAEHEARDVLATLARELEPPDESAEVTPGPGSRRMTQPV